MIRHLLGALLVGICHTLPQNIPASYSFQRFNRGLDTFSPGTVVHHYRAPREYIPHQSNYPAFESVHNGFSQQFGAEVIDSGDINDAFQALPQTNVGNSEIGVSAVLFAPNTDELQSMKVRITEQLHDTAGNFAADVGINGKAAQVTKDDFITQISEKTGVLGIDETTKVQSLQAAELKEDISERAAVLATGIGQVFNNKVNAIQAAKAGFVQRVTNKAGALVLNAGIGIQQGINYKVAAVKTAQAGFTEYISGKAKQVAAGIGNTISRKVQALGAVQTAISETISNTVQAAKTKISETVRNKAVALGEAQAAITARISDTFQAAKLSVADQLQQRAKAVSEAKAAFADRIGEKVKSATVGLGYSIESGAMAVSDALSRSINHKAHRISGYLTRKGEAINAAINRKTQLLSTTVPTNNSPQNEATVSEYSKEVPQFTASDKSLDLNRFGGESVIGQVVNGAFQHQFPIYSN